ncbi:MAG: hypothetical protein HKN50_13060, partial [Gammaproteobacteria bacterium]|nr:hypothetical protein [Gammaproteobacteria bacterium]
MFGGQLALREIVLGSDNQRLLRAATAALLAHSLLFAFGFWTISQFSVPSDVNRGIVITLDKALREGLKAPDAPALDTINDAQVGAPESLRPRFEPSELSQLNDTPMAKPAAEIRLPAAATPSAEISETSEVSPATSVLESAPPTTVHTANLSDAPGDTAPDLATEIAAGAQTQPIEAPVLTKATGELTISSAQPTPHPETASEVSMTQRQKRMLDKKLKKWAEKIDDLEEAPEAVSWRHRGQTYVAKFSRLPASGEMAMDKMVVEVTTEQDGQRLTTTMKMKQLAFSNFAQFVHRWDPELLL